MYLINIENIIIFETFQPIIIDNAFKFNITTITPFKIMVCPYNGLWFALYIIYIYIYLTVLSYLLFLFFTSLNYAYSYNCNFIYYLIKI